MKFLVSTVFLSLALCSMAQHVVVKDVVTHEALVGVSIFDKDKLHFETTAKNGKAQLDGFDT